MTLEYLQQEMNFALKNRNSIRKDTIFSLIGAVKKAGIEKGYRNNIPEELVNQTILRELRITQEMINTCPASRVKVLKEYQDRRRIIEEFVPKVLTDKEEIKNLILSLGIVVNGKNRSAIMSRLNGKVNMQIASEVLMEII